MNPTTKKHIITALKFAISIGILWWLFHSESKNAEFDNFFARDKKWGWVGIGFLLALIAHLIGFVRWRIMVRALDIPFSVMDAIRIGFIGVFFNMVAFGVIGGDSLRAFYVTRQVKDRAPEAILSVVADRIIGLLTMFSIAATMFLFLDFESVKSVNPEAVAGLSFVCKAVVVLTTLGYLGVLTIFCAPWITKLSWYQSLLKIPKVGGILEKLTEVALMYRSRPGTVALCFLLSVGVNVCFIGSIYSMAVGIADSFPSLGDHFVIEPISMVANAVPLPGGMGGMESAMKLLYQSFGFTSGLLVAFAFRFALLFVTAIGAVFWFVNRSKVAAALKDSEA